MKTAVLSIALILSTLAAGAQSLSQRFAAQLTEPQRYTVYRAGERLKIDGRLDEKAWQAALPTTEFVDISGEGFPTPKYKTTAKMLWDDEYLYIGAVIEEPNITGHLTQRDTIIYRDNDFEVFIDPDGDGVGYFEFENNAKGTLMDLFMPKSYRCGGDFVMSWDCKGWDLKVSYQGTLNKSKDTDRSWTVEMAIPAKEMAIGFASPLKAGAWWRLNFSRVEWLNGPDKPEENWVWSPTGAVNMHMPERWGYIYFDEATVGTKQTKLGWPYDMNVYRMAWTIFYAQSERYEKSHNYYRTAEQLFLTDAELATLPEGTTIDIDASQHSYVARLTVKSEGQVYCINSEGRFWMEPIAKRQVKNWCWTNLHKFKTLAEWQSWFALLKQNCISAVLFEGYDEAIYRACHEAGLEAHYWKWTMNRGECRKTHPEWFAVSRSGKSCYDNPAYVEYYRFLCPYREGVAEYLAADYVRESHLPYVDGVHLDYVRMPDVVLPIGLWKNYGIDQTRELPEYDFCYCDVCCRKFEELTGRDPRKVAVPQEDQSWINFRLDGITRVVNTITRAVKADGKFVSAAVFPGPSMARKMVRQDWGNWPLDAYFPMTYNGFYNESPEWVGRSVEESVKTVGGRAQIYPGLMFNDIKGDDFERAIGAALEAGASGISFFDGPDAEYLTRFRKYIEDHGYEVVK